MASNYTQIELMADVHALGGHGTGSTATGGRFEQMLPVFNGEILTARENHLMFRNMVRTHTPTAPAIHHDFPMLWKIGSEIHQRGEELLGTDVTTGRRRITLDDRPRVAHIMIDDIDELLSQWSTRSELAREMGIELAEQTDADICKLLVLAARTNDTTVFPGGGSDGAGAAIAIGADSDGVTAAEATAVLSAIDTAVVRWDSVNMPDRNRFCAIRPERWHKLRDLSRIGAGPASAAAGTPELYQATPVTGQPGGPGGPDITADSVWGDFILYKGVKIYRSNLIPSEDLSNDQYRAGNYSGTQGVIWTPDAIGFLEGMGIMTETEHSVKSGSDFLVSKILIGGGTLRAESAIELDAT